MVLDAYLEDGDSLYTKELVSFDFDAGFEARLTEPSQRLSNEDLAHLVPQPEVVDGPSAVGVIVALALAIWVMLQ